MVDLKFQLNLRSINSGKQKGASLLILVLILVIAGTGVFVSYLNIGSMKNDRNKTTIAALAEAKGVLLGFTIGASEVSSIYLPNPDLLTTSEGSEAGSAGTKDFSLIGKFPWRSLGSLPIKDGWSECLWYVVSGRFKNSPRTDVLNWDTQGQIDVVDGNGNMLATNLAALIVSPGPILGGQDRSLLSSNLLQCRGNYDARNYLDTYAIENAIGGEVNYFPGSPYNRQATNTSNKTFVLANNDYYNDRFLFITADDIFQLLIRRNDFSAQVTALLNDPAFNDPLMIPSIGKGTENLNCSALDPSNRDFCDNWKEMLLLKNLLLPSQITIDGTSTAVCARVLIFAGQRTVGQIRETLSDKANPANYIEGDNLTAFNDDTGEFDGVSAFDPNNPSADILRCI